MPKRRRHSGRSRGAGSQDGQEEPAARRAGEYRDGMAGKEEWRISMRSGRGVSGCCVTRGPDPEWNHLGLCIGIGDRLPGQRSRMPLQLTHQHSHSEGGEVSMLVVPAHRLCHSMRHITNHSASRASDPGEG